MLKKIIFENNMPYKIEVIELDGEEMHYHDEVVESVFVIKGEVTYKCFNDLHKLASGKGVIITPMEDHAIECGETAIIAKLYFNPQFFEVNKIRSIIDLLLTINKAGEIYYALELRNLMVRILLLAYKGTEESEKIISKLVKQSYQMITLMISQHPCYQNSKVEITQPVLERYKRILDFLKENYNRPIQNSEVAEREHISETRLSHFWKDVTGFSFQNTITQMKMFKARELIINSNTNIQEIAKLCGYSEIRHFYKCFKEQYKISPQKYRDQYLAALQHPQYIFKYNMLSKQEAEVYINENVIQYYTINNELPQNIILKDDILKEKALSDLLGAMQKNQFDSTKVMLEDKPMLCTIPILKNKGIYFEDNEYKVNWEYIYIAIQYVVKCGFNACILIDYELMEESEWHNILLQLQEEVYRIWGRELTSSFQCNILIRKFYSYDETKNLIKRFKKLTTIYKKIDTLYILQTNFNYD
jgi:AraC-like DNA-binding protein